MSLGLLRWLAPPLPGLRSDQIVVQAATSVPPFYEGVFRRADFESRAFLLPDPHTSVRGHPMLLQGDAPGPHDLPGFRNSHIAHVADVVVIGDSMTYGNDAMRLENWPSRLAEALPGMRRTVYAMATGGWGAVQYPDMTRYAATFRPRAVVVAYTTGNGSLEAFKIAHEFERFAFLRLDRQLSAGDQPKVGYPAPVSQPWELRFRYGVETVVTPELRLAANDRAIPAVEAGCAIMRNRPVSSRKPRTASAHVAFTIIPTKEFGYAKKIERTGVEVPSALSRLIAEEGRQIEEFARPVRAVPAALFVDLVMPLRQAADKPLPLNPATENDHPVAAGYQVIGRAVAREIAALLPELPLGPVFVGTGKDSYAVYLVGRQGVWLVPTREMLEANDWQPGRCPVVSDRDIASLPGSASSTRPRRRVSGRRHHAERAPRWRRSAVLRWPTMAIETELKLAIEPAGRRALLRHRLIGAALPLGSQKLVNTYFDTPELALRRRGVALRLRRQGRRWLQTVKCAGTTTGGLSSRPEWEAAWSGGDFDFTLVEDAAVRRWLERPRLRARLGPVFQTAFSRRSWRCEPAPGVAVLLMLDVGSIASNGRSATISELELELAAGEPGDLLELARALAADIPLRPEPLSKAQRGYLLFAPNPTLPLRAQGSPLSAPLDVAGGFRAVTLACLAQLQANEAGAREGRDPEFVHQMRVALRRLRSALRLFAPVLAPERAAEIDAELAQLATRLGVARDWDVLVEDTLRPVMRAFSDDPRLSELAAAAGARRRAAQAAAGAELGQPRYGRLALSLLAFCHGRDTLRPEAMGADLPRFARRRVAALQKRLRKRARRAATLDVSALHRLRIAAKRLRYALEFFAPVLPDKTVRRNQRRMAALQDDLGFLNDQANAGRVLADLAGGETVLREAAALVAGWYGPRCRDVMDRLPGEIRALDAHRAF